MHTLIRKLSFGCTILLPFVFPVSPVLSAQNAQNDGPPNVLVIQREFLKPGKGGMAHERSEAAFVRAFAIRQKSADNSYIETIQITNDRFSDRNCQK
jgi:hypothetical protein